MLRRLLGAAFALWLGGASVGAAQVSIGVGAQYVTLAGDDFNYVDAGFGGQGHVLFSLTPDVKVGATVQYARHRFQGQNLNWLGGFGEARYMVASGAGSTTVYLAARAGWMQGKVNGITNPNFFTADSATGTGDVSGSGLAFGAGMGVMTQVKPAIGLDFTVLVNSVSLGKPEFRTSGGTFTWAEAVNGQALIIRAGVTFKLGS